MKAWLQQLIDFFSFGKSTAAPVEGSDTLPAENLLTVEEIEKLMEVALSANDIHQLFTRGWVDRRGDRFPPVSNRERPADYQHDLARGTIEYKNNWRNYSFHNVVIAPGTSVLNCNFTQAAPNTPAIQCDGELTFVECNLGNCALDPRWVLLNCNTVQSWILADSDGNEKRSYVCEHPDKLTGKETAPANAVLSRAF